MRNGLIVLGVVVVLAFLAWHFVFTKEAAVETYQGFATAIVKGGPGEGEAYCDGEAVKAALQNRASYTPFLIEAFKGARYQIESKKKSGDTMELVAVQTVAYDPSGTYSALRPGAVAQFRHRVTLKKRAGGWKVVAFASEPLPPPEAR